jgi:hypothetical protein
MGSIFPQAPSRKVVYGRSAIEGQIKHPKRHEDNLQLRCANYMRENYPDVIFFCDSGAGQNMSDTQRKLMMASRSDDGIPDFHIDYASRGYHGARFELKKEGTKVYKKDGITLRKQPYTRKYKRYGKWFIKRGDHLAEQAATLKKYRRNGYCGMFVIGFEDFKKKADWYMDKKIELDLF